MNPPILDFLTAFHPDVIEEYERYLRRNDYPAIGTEVKTLRSGYGDRAGVTRYVAGYQEDGILLSFLPGAPPKWICNKTDWWKELQIMKETKKIKE